MVRVGDLEPMLKSASKNAASIFDFYCGHFRKLDSLHRAFEHAVADVRELDCLGALVPAARQAYRKLAESLQSRFIQAVETEGLAGQRQTATDRSL